MGPCGRKPFSIFFSPGPLQGRSAARQLAWIQPKSEAGEPCPPPLAGHASALLGGRWALLWGGTDEGSGASSALHALHLPTCRWTSVQGGGEPPPAMAYATAVAAHPYELPRRETGGGGFPPGSGFALLQEGMGLVRICPPWSLSKSRKQRPPPRLPCCSPVVFLFGGWLGGDSLSNDCFVLEALGDLAPTADSRQERGGGGLLVGEREGEEWGC